jgi:hypothetical protein
VIFKEGKVGKTMQTSLHLLHGFEREVENYKQAKERETITDKSPCFDVV